MLKSFSFFGGLRTVMSLNRALLFGVACCVGLNAHAYDPSSVRQKGFEWLYRLNNATGFDLSVDGSLIKGNATTLPSGKMMDLQNVSCQGRGKARCSSGNVADCIKTSLCTLSDRKTLFKGEVVTLPGTFSVKTPSGKTPAKIKVQLQVNNVGKGQILKVMKAGSN